MKLLPLKKAARDVGFCAGTAPTGSKSELRRTPGVALPICCLSLVARKPAPDGYPEHPETVGEHIRKRRMDLGLFQRQAAAEINVNKATIWNWEHNESSPAIRHWPAVLAFLGYDPHPEPRTLAERMMRLDDDAGCPAGSSPGS